ncbi:unnamed protein product [Rotaria magnacalcarata]|uniref:Uncharacterized protein n=1 Tax=Rotaria magnacalcarata TaxID=392030 RepID=A0A8S3FHY1_9BILA|nr:unnamed protein product [Rotaria magnacalcarata]CAF5120255.1 unnamed protein product [Rotaria magnacalcarata]
MAVELGITTCITLLQYSIELAEQVKANKQLCAELAADLAIIESILSSLDQQEKERAKRHHLNLVLKKLRILTNQTSERFRSLGLTEQQSLDESVFDTLEENELNEEYYIVDDNDD